MREINLNGYIDDEVWWGDEITPEALHEVLYGVDGQMRDDVHICLNSYGGSCNAATRMFDDIRAYPGNVAITVSGTAASAATVLAMAANRLEMTPGSLFMIHDPIVGAVGNEQELTDAIRLLRACKDSILNVYAVRCRLSRNDISEKMTATCWMDAQSALSNGFIDGITDGIHVGSALNAAETHIVDRAEAEKRVKMWIERKTVKLSHSDRNVDIESSREDDARDDEQDADLPTIPQSLDAPTADHDDALPDSNSEQPPNEPDNPNEPEIAGTPVAQLQKRLGLIMPSWR